MRLVLACCCVRVSLRVAVGPLVRGASSTCDVLIALLTLFLHRLQFGYGYVMIGKEIIKVSAVGATTLTIAQRGAFGTPITTHPTTAVVYGLRLPRRCAFVFLGDRPARDFLMGRVRIINRIVMRFIMQPSACLRSTGHPEVV